MELDIVTTITLLKGLVVKRLSFFLHIWTSGRSIYAGRFVRFSKPPTAGGKVCSG